MRTKRYVRIGEREREIEIEDHDGTTVVRLDGAELPVELLPLGDGLTHTLRLGDRTWEIMAQPAEGGYTVLANGQPFHATVQDERTRRLAQASPAGSRHHGGRVEVKAPMPGLVLSLAVAVGDEVLPDARLLSLEAMKMENELRANGPGTVVEVRVSAGQKVDQGQVLLVVE